MRVQNDGKSDIMKILSEINTTLNKLDNNYIEKDSISLTHGLPYMAHPEICGNHKFYDPEKLRDTCGLRDLIPSWAFVTKYC